MAFKKENNYFEMIEELAALSLEAAQSLNHALRNFNVSELSERKEILHKIEHNADLKKHDMIKKLSREFITPIEREDIMNLGEEIDNVTDGIEEVIGNIYMYNISKLMPESVVLSDIVLRCCSTLKDIAVEFKNFRKSATINKLIIEINALEEEGGRVFTDAMRRLYTENDNALKIIIWKDIFESLENCCDSCEHAADVIERVIMKNT